jgi:hypothetical protein
MRPMVQIFRHIRSDSVKRTWADEIPQNFRQIYKTIYKRLGDFSQEQLCDLLGTNAFYWVYGEALPSASRTHFAICDAICQQDALFELSPRNLEKIPNSFKPGAFGAHPELFYRLEPYILKHIREFSPNQLLDIASTYIKLGSGSEEFLNEVLAFSALASEDANLRSIEGLIRVLGPKHTLRQEFVIDCSRIMPIFARNILTKLKELNPEK